MNPKLSIMNKVALTILLLLAFSMAAYAMWRELGIFLKSCQ
jgi:hypothetical protein